MLEAIRRLKPHSLQSFALLSRPKNEHIQLLAAVDAAAVLRMFDVALLAGMLVDEANATRSLEILEGWAFVEPFPSLNRKTPETFIVLLGWAGVGGCSAIVAPNSTRYPHERRSCMRMTKTPRGRIEWLYHCLAANPDTGASELARLNQVWVGNAEQEDRYALAAALRELKETGIVEGRARLWVRLVIGGTDMSRAEESRLVLVEARELVLIARKLHDAQAEAEAYRLAGEALLGKKSLPEAETASGKRLAVHRQLAEVSPADKTQQRDLAAALAKLAQVLQEQGGLTEAQEAPEKDPLLVPQRAEADPKDVRWQHELNSARSRDAAETQRKLTNLSTGETTTSRADANFKNSVVTHRPSTAGCK